jgi:hypothetical protein
MAASVAIAGCRQWFIFAAGARAWSPTCTLPAAETRLERQPAQGFSWAWADPARAS